MIRHQRRAEIVAEARALVAEGGVSALTIGALEKRIPYTRGVITHHFQGKHEIVHAVLESAAQEIDAPLADDILRGQPWPDRVRAVLDSKVKGFLHHAEATWILLSFLGETRSDAVAAERNSAVFERYRGQSAALLEVGLDQGHVHHDVDLAAMAALWVATVIGLVVQVTLAPNVIDVDAAIHIAAESFVARCSTDPNRAETAPI